MKIVESNSSPSAAPVYGRPENRCQLDIPFAANIQFCYVHRERTTSLGGVPWGVRWGHPKCSETPCGSRGGVSWGRHPVHIEETRSKKYDSHRLTERRGSAKSYS